LGIAVRHWLGAIANPTVADAILDRLVHNAHRLTLKGGSLRKAAAKRSALDEKDVVRPHAPVDGSRCPQSP